MRSVAVLDTNVLLDLYVFEDPRTVLLKQAIEINTLDCLTCDQAIVELTDVLAREKFRLCTQRQQEILLHWRAASRVVAATEILAAPWRCKDKADQIFLDLAWTHRPCALISKDLQVLRFAKRAFKEGVVISETFQ
ncbi:MAG: putative toxin-antitoxin system toxin component, PIN family [Burkholderiaceae bacterium]|nr:putative toxin-antitoxin system toxin component, PIN family [Burkholderiaceae bacterium]